MKLRTIATIIIAMVYLGVGFGLQMAVEKCHPDLNLTWTDRAVVHFAWPFLVTAAVVASRGDPERKRCAWEKGEGKWL